MLIIAGTITLDPAQIDDAMALAIPFCELVRAEPGCVDYLFTPNPANAGELRLFEIWESEADLEAHFTTPHMAEWQQAVGAMTLTGRDIVRYEVNASAPL
ncbi:MAG: putative quinol monooxygenase [Actinomycetota bacterium]